MQAKVSPQEPESGKNFNFKLRWEKGEVISISPNASLKEAAQLMKQHQIGDVLVINEESGEGLQGIVTDRDIALCIASEASIEDLSVADVMADSVISASDKDDIFKLINMMHQSGVTRIPLKDDDENIVGVVTAKNLLEVLVNGLFELTQISDQQKDQQKGQQKIDERSH